MPYTINKLFINIFVLWLLLLLPLCIKKTSLFCIVSVVVAVVVLYDESTIEHLVVSTK